MTEIIGFAALAAGGYWIYSRMKRKMAEVEKHLADISARATGAPRDAGNLIRDPKTGRYRPEQG
ncbi:hypothetical protein [Roseibium suaedae]|uniref:Uncharacterized protein n=1 Tax=Roseibium suaedae TaxID=735517 RepID=A0A1M7B0R5_9HYPH|nr:hypothetical protein [Roseibium suaedae]SHL48541.1 hypothetical protein SAMN05444272_0695 [Roseibium suaedae]